LCTRIQK